MSAKTYVVDSGNVTRFPKRWIAIDSGNVARVAKRVWFIDSGNVARLIFTGADYLTMVSGTSAGETGYFVSSFGTLTPTVLGDGATVRFLFTTLTTPPMHQLLFQISGYAGTIVSTYLTSLTIDGSTLPVGTSTFSGGGVGGQAEWTWSPSPNLAAGTTYPVIVQRSA